MSLSSAPSETRFIASLASLYIVRMLGLFMVLPVLTLSVEEYSGANLFLLGVALGVYGLSQALLQIPYGLLSDRFGRKPLIAIGLLIFALGSLVAASAETVWGLIVGRALQGAGAIAGVVMATVGDLTSEENRTKAMAVIGASIGVAFALSLVLGPVITALGGVRWVFWLSLLLSVIGLLILWRLVPSPERHRADKSIFQGMDLIILNAELWRLNFGIFILHGVLMALFVAMPLLLLSVGLAQTYHSWAYLGVMASAFCLMVPLIIWGERQQRLKTVFLLVLLMTLFALVGLVFFDDDIIPVMCAMLLFFVGFNYLEATLPSLMTKTVSASCRGAGSALFSTCQFLGAALGGVAGGAIYSRFGISSLFVFCSAGLLLWWLLALGMVVPKRTHVAAENMVG